MFGFVILVVAIIWTLAARKPLGPVLGWGIGLAVAAGLLAAIGILPLTSGAGAAGLGAAFGSVVGATRAFRPPRGRPRHSDFEATHAHDHLAINTQRAQVWARDQSGREVVLEAHEVRQWTHRWVPDKGYKARNRIELTTTRVDFPIVTVPFERHSATVWGAPKNAREAEEWHARLGAFLDR